MKLAGKVGCGAGRVQSVEKSRQSAASPVPGMARSATPVFNAVMADREDTARSPLWLRAFRVSGSYLIASLAAGAALVLPAVLIPALDNPASLSDFGMSAYLIGTLIFLMSVYVAAFAVIPSVVAVLVMRAARLKRGLWDSLFGIVIGGGLAALILTGSRNEEWAVFLALFAFAGAVGGMVYWLANARPQPPYRSWL